VADRGQVPESKREQGEKLEGAGEYEEQPTYEKVSSGDPIFIGAAAE
jgi:hypothetical protein